MRAALAAYRLSADTRFRPLRRTNNIVYEVVNDGLPDGHSVLRVHRPNYRTTDQTRAELMLPAAVGESLAETGVRVPSPIRTSGGELLVESAEGHIDLLTWVDGEVRRPSMGLGPSGCGALGNALASIHTAAQGAPSTRGLPVWDAAGLAGERSPFRPGPLEDVLSPAEAELLREVERRAGEVFRRLDDVDGSRGVIHADFILGNCHLVRRGPRWSVGVIDFDDCGTGYFAYDVATLADNLADFPSAKRNIAAFLEGYRAMRVLPRDIETELPVLMAVRHAASCLWAAAMIRRGEALLDYRSLIDGRMDQIRLRLRRPSPAADPDLHPQGVQLRDRRASSVSRPVSRS